MHSGTSTAAPFVDACSATPLALDLALSDSVESAHCVDLMMHKRPPRTKRINTKTMDIQTTIPTVFRRMIRNAKPTMSEMKQTMMKTSNGAGA